MRALVWVALALAARLRRQLPVTPSATGTGIATVTQAAAAKLASIPDVPFPSSMLDALRHELVTTDDTMKEAQKQIEHLDGSNAVLQNLVIVAFREMRSLKEVLDTVSPELEQCVALVMPERVNLTAHNGTLQAHIQNTTNFTSQALRAEMHLLRVYDEELSRHQADLEACRLCAPPQIILHLQQVDSAVRNETKPVLPRLIDELEDLHMVFQNMAGQTKAAGASQKVLEGMSAEAFKALFKFQHEVDTLEEQVWECGNRTAPFEIHPELDDHLSAFPAVSASMIRRAQDETAVRAIEVSKAQTELDECRIGCPAPVVPTAAP